MKILIVFLIVISSFGGLMAVLIGIDSCTSRGKKIILLGIICMLCGIILYSIALNLWSGKIIKSSTFDINTEIRQEYLNGEEIGRDTIYIFTPKKK